MLENLDLRASSRGDNSASPDLYQRLLPTLISSSHGDQLATSINPKPSDSDLALMKREESQLSSSMKNYLHDAARQWHFRENLDQFEKNAERNHLSTNQITQTFAELDRIVQDSAKTVSKDLQTKFVEQWAEDLAHATNGKNGTLRQGNHDTCAFAMLELYTQKHNPELITRMTADALTGHAINITSFQEGNKELSSLAIAPDSLKPDSEAQDAADYAVRRRYADQVAQVALESIKWQTNDQTPDGEVIEIGSMSYGQCANVVRPSVKNPTQDQSCEYVDVKSKSGETKRFDDNGFGFGGASTPDEVSRVEFLLTGKMNQVTFLRTSDANKNEHGDVSTFEDFSHQLNQLAVKDNLPAGVFVDPGRPGIAEDYMRLHPEKKEIPPFKVYHDISITKVNSDNTVETYNTWGVKRTMTQEQLWQAMLPRS